MCQSYIMVPWHYHHDCYIKVHGNVSDVNVAAANVVSPVNVAPVNPSLWHVKASVNVAPVNVAAANVVSPDRLSGTHSQNVVVTIIEIYRVYWKVCLHCPINLKCSTQL